MGLRAYVEDQDIVDTLNQYGEIKGEVIRLKYKNDHDLAGLENGNRLVRMVLTKPSIPYSVKIADEWCRIIHNNQQPICSECNEVGHSRRRCPEIICRTCNGNGHMSHDCDERPPSPPPTPPNPSTPQEQDAHETDHDQDISEPEPTAAIPPETQPTEPPSTGITNDLPSTPKPLTNTTSENMEHEDSTKGQKRPHITDSDSDNPQDIPIRRNRINPAPNLSAGRPNKSTKQ